MSTIIKRGNVWHYQWCIHGKARRKSLKTSDEATAKRLQKVYDVRLEQMAQGLAPAKAPLLDALDEWFVAQQGHLKPRSIAAYSDHLRHIRAWIETTELKYCHQLTRIHVDDFVTEQHKHFSPKTVDDQMSVLRACLNWLWKSKRLESLPVREWPRIKTVSKTPGRLKNYTRDEIARLDEYFRWRPFWPVFRFTIFTGARREEVHNVRAGDVHFSDGVIWLRSGKTESDVTDQMRPVGIDDAILPVLMDRCRGRGPDDLLFPELLQHSRNWPHNEMRKACAALNIGYKRFHGLRHSYATYLLEGGASPRAVMDAMGHKRIETTLKYAHLVKMADVKKLGYDLK